MPPRWIRHCRSGWAVDIARFPRYTFLTVDRENFTLYRRNQTQTLPCDFGPAIKL